MAAAFTGGMTFKQGDTASPIVYTAIEEVVSLSGFGLTNPLIDVTSHDSTAREYIAGLGDGSEITVECNRVHTASNQQDTVITNITAQSTLTYQLAINDSSTSPNVSKTYTFSGVCLSYQITPSFDDKHMIAFTFKISGSIVET